MADFELIFFYLGATVLSCVSCRNSTVGMIKGNRNKSSVSVLSKALHHSKKVDEEHFSHKAAHYSTILFTLNCWFLFSF